MTFNNSLVFQPSILPPALPQSQLLTYFTKKMEAVRREKPPNLLTYSYSAFPVVEAIEPSLPSQITLPLLHWIPSASLTHPFAVIPSYSCIPTNKLSALSQIFKKSSLEPKLMLPLTAKIFNHLTPFPQTHPNQAFIPTTPPKPSLSKSSATCMWLSSRGQFAVGILRDLSAVFVVVDHSLLERLHVPFRASHCPGFPSSTLATLQF